MSEANVVIVGAGVIGLTTAMLLSADKSFKVTVLAKHMPGDYDIEYASPWAGANYLPVGKPGSDLAQYERDTWPELAKLATEVLEAGVHFQDTTIYNRNKDHATPVGAWMSSLISADPWFKDVVPNFRNLTKDELPPGIEADSGTAFTSVCINTAIYLPWLAGQCLRNGAILRRAVLSHISEAASLHHSGKRANVVVNCTGLGSLKLGGVEDKDVYPARGQIVLVRNDPKIMTSISGTDDGDDEVTYVMHRAAGGGTILGGCLQAHSWESQPDPNLSIRIMKRSVALAPELTAGRGIEHLSIIRHGVGLRPMRTGGPRVEMQEIDGLKVVHAYAFGGYGYQASFGGAFRALKLIGQAAGREVSKEVHL